MLSLYVIGCGGIGGYLIDMLPMAISSLSLDLLCDQSAVEQYLRSAGQCAIPSCVDNLVLVDGDTFNARNALRQGCCAGSKLVQRMRAIKDSMVYNTYLSNMNLVGVNKYINPLNMSSIIPETPPLNKDNKEARRVISPRIGTTQWSVIFLCVDNAKTRYEVSRYAETLHNVLVINGGNEKTTGHVTVYERDAGDALDPNLYEVYTDINNTTDKRPDEEACTNIAPKHDQIAVTNSIVANVMLAVFNRWAREGLMKTDRRGNVTRINEVLIDMETFAMMSVYHPKTT